MPLRRLFSLRALLPAGVLALLLVGSSSQWLPWFGTALVSDDQPVRSDAVLVLAGDPSGARICKGGDLVRAGFAPKAYVSSPGEVYGREEADLAIDLAVAKGYPREFFVPLYARMDSTREEAGVVWERFQKDGVRSFLLVTSDYHTRRAGRVFRRQLPNAPFRVIAAPTRDLDPPRWWHSRPARKTIFLEWTKTVADLFRI